MRKILCLILTGIALMAFFMPQGAFALSQTTLTIGSVSGTVGSNVTVPINFSNVPASGIGNIDFVVAFDSSVLDVVSVDAGSIVKNPSVDFDKSILAGKVVLFFFDDTVGGRPISSDGTFANITFKIKSAAVSTVNVESIGAVNDSNLYTVKVTTVDGTVKGSIQSTNSVSPAAITYDTVALPQLTVTINTSAALTDIKNGTGTLIKGTDYFVSGNSVSIAKGYLNYYFTKFKNDLTLNFIFSNGNPAVLTVKPVSPNFSTITPGEVKVDPQNISDVSVSLNLNGNTLVSVNNGTSALSSVNDYSMSGNNVTIKKSYIKYYFTKFPNQNLNIRFIFSNGYESVLSLYQGVSPNSIVDPVSINYTVGSGADANFAVATNGNFFSSIYNGTSALVPRVDYTFSVTTNTLSIRKSYLNYYFGKFNKNLVLNVNFTGGKPQTLTIVPKSTEIKKELTVTAGKVSGNIGDIVTVPITLSGNYKIYDASMSIQYDSNVLEFVDVSQGALFSDKSRLDKSITANKIILLYTDLTEGKNPLIENGVFANIRFKIKAAASGSTNIKFGQIADGGFLDENLIEIYTNYIDGSVTYTVPKI
ncbi:MAG TPA: cohesin domain-containing protein [Clostridia bacterium]